MRNRNMCNVEMQKHCTLRNKRIDAKNPYVDNRK